MRDAGREMRGPDPGDLTHFDPSGAARMVDVGDKAETLRTAEAMGRILISPRALEMVEAGTVGKGDVLGVARLAGIMAAKRTPDFIPLCHNITLSGVDVAFHADRSQPAIEVRCRVRCRGRTGAEMEALTGVALSCLTIYDMLKSVDRTMEIEGIRLVRKSGGASGDFSVEEGKGHVSAETDADSGSDGK